VAGAPEVIVPRRLGPYLIGRKLGAGGMATVYAARQEGTHVKRLVALKVLSANVSKEDEEHRAFVREALVATRLEHPNIVRTYDVGDVDGTLYLAMELVHGASLSACGKAADGPVATPIAAKIVCDIARALHAAHMLEDPEKGHLGVVHQDVSPQNVLIGYDGSIKLVDFGVARFGTLEGSRTESLRGKPSYASPEQIAGKHIDRRTDVFALGVVMWELFTGERLFKRETSAATYLAVLQDPIPDIREIHPIAPEPIARVVAKALEREKDKRYATAEELRRALEAALAECKGEFASSEKIGAWVTKLVAPTIVPADLEREIVKADGAASGRSPSAVDSTERSPAPKLDPNIDIPDLDLPGQSHTRPAAQKRPAPSDPGPTIPVPRQSSPEVRQPSSPGVPELRQQSSPAVRQSSPEVRQQSSPGVPELRQQSSPAIRQSSPEVRQQSSPSVPRMPAAKPPVSFDDDDDMQIEHNMSAAMGMPMDGMHASGAPRPRPVVASTGLDLAAERRDARAREDDDPDSLVRRIIGWSIASVLFAGATFALVRFAHGSADSMMLTRALPHAFDGTSSIHSGAVSIVALVLAVAAGWAGAKLRPRSWALVGSATGLLLTSLAMVTVTLATTGEPGAPPDGVLLMPYVVPIALAGLALGVNGRAAILFRGSIARKAAGVPVALIAAIIAFAAYANSFLLTK
jgi:serine/threonine-protein kinase